MMIGVAWYREHDWPRVKSEFPDAADLHDTHEQWRRETESAINQLTALGYIVTPVTIDIDEFIGWCMVRGRKRDGKARSEYVTEKMGANQQVKK
jgi:hypothetical protein